MSVGISLIIQLTADIQAVIESFVSVETSFTEQLALDITGTFVSVEISLTDWNLQVILFAILF